MKSIDLVLRISDWTAVIPGVIKDDGFSILLS